MDYKEMNQGKYSCQCNSKDNNKNNKDNECKGTVLESNTLSECPSTSSPHFPYFKVPVVIAEFTVQIDSESKIRLAEPAIEIKRIKKNVFLNQCRLVGKTGKVFISGFVRKNIEYATMDCCNNSSVSGDIKHTTVHVPFRCITELKNMRTPHLQFNEPAEEMFFFDEKNMGRSMKETDMKSEEFFNEKVFCELVHASIHEADIVEEFEKLQCIQKEIVFQTFIEKEVICLTIKLLQKQQVCDEKPHKKPHCDWQEPEQC